MADAKAPPPLSFDVSNPSETVLDKGVISVFLYGPSGSYKTRSAAGFPKPMFIDFEDTEVSIRDFKDARRIRVQKWTTMVEISVSLTRIRKEIYDFKTLVVDSGTIAYDRCVHEVAAAAGNAVPTLPNFYTGSDKVKEMWRILKDWCKVNKSHLIILATDQIIKDEVSGVSYGAPDLGRKAGTEIAQLCDIYGHLTMKYDDALKIVVRNLWPVQKDAFPAKDRLGILPVPTLLSSPDGKAPAKTLWQHIYEKAPWLLA